MLFLLKLFSMHVILFFISHFDCVKIKFIVNFYFQKEFDFLCNCVSQLMERPEQLSALEKSALLETLMVLR